MIRFTRSLPAMTARLSNPFNDRRNLLLLSFWAVILAFDQITKAVVRNTMYVGESIPADAPVRFTYVQNTGSAFGLFANQTFVLTIAAVVGVIVIAFVLVRQGRASNLLAISLTMQLAGAIGNLIDRISYGYVVDFVDFRFWPVFNVADSSITIGFILLAAALLFSKDSKDKATDGSLP